MLASLPILLELYTWQLDLTADNICSSHLSQVLTGMHRIWQGFLKKGWAGSTKKHHTTHTTTYVSIGLKNLTDAFSILEFDTTGKAHTKERSDAKSVDFKLKNHKFTNTLEHSHYLPEEARLRRSFSSSRTLNFPSYGRAPRLEKGRQVPNPVSAICSARDCRAH